MTLSTLPLIAINNLNPFLNNLKFSLENKPPTNFQSAHALIFIGSKILLIKENEQNFFNLPGGKPEINENALETIIREIREETGLENLQISFLGLLSSNELVFPLFVTKFTSEKPVIKFGEDIVEYSFVEKNDLINKLKGINTSLANSMEIIL